MLTIGLTGGIGSGKSSAAAIFAQFDIISIDADQITRDLMSPNGLAYPALRFWLGHNYFESNGGLHRNKLRELVFNDSNRLRKLESIVHPLVGLGFAERLKKIPETSPYVILEIPLLTNKHKKHLVDRVLVIDCTEDTQIERGSARDNSNAEEIKKIIAQQLSREERLALADDVINNDGSLAKLQSQIEALHQVYLDLADKDH